MPKIVLRTADAADGRAIARIQFEAWRATYAHLNSSIVDRFDLDRTADNWAGATVDSTLRVRLADLDDTTVGYALSGPTDPPEEGIGAIDAVYVLSSAHGSGVGRLLVEDALTALARSGYAECVLWVADQNAHARGFYEHLGFRDDGGRDTWHDLPVLRYRLQLGGT
jgi:ribosomal protein S18 acetylase RimI-like enzyme